MSIILTPDKPGALIALWSKYRPVIVHLMLASGDGQKQYKLYSHEFKALHAKATTFTFTLQAYKGKAMNDIRKSHAAQDLMSMLNMSPKASEQLARYAFEFRLDSKFMLHIGRLQIQ